MSTIQAESTCSGCMHHVTPSKHFEGSKRCELKRVYFDDCARSCPQFNAPTVLYWVPEFVEDRSGHVILLNWQLRAQSEHNQCGFERLGKLRRTHDGWVALRYGQPVLVWKRSDEGIKHCARALVEHAKGDR